MLGADLSCDLEVKMRVGTRNVVIQSRFRESEDRRAGLYCICSVSKSEQIIIKLARKSPKLHMDQFP
jgi:hypothetical protein